MTSEDSMRGLSARLWRAVSTERQKQFLGVLTLMIIGSIMEVASIGAVLPFLGALASPERFFTNPLLHPLFGPLGISSPQDIIAPLTIAFCLVSIAAGAMRIVVLRASLSYSFGLGAELSTEVYRRSLYQPYSVHVARNSSEIINGIAIKTSEVIFYVIVPTMTLLSGALMSAAIIATLAMIIPMAAMASFAVFGLLYAFMMMNVRRRLKENSEKIARESTNSIRYLQEGLGGIRDILLDGRQENFISTFTHADRTMRNAQRANQVTSFVPRYVMESLGMVLIAALALFLSQGTGGVASVVPTLAALALGLQRLLPSLQQLYQSWSTIQSAEASLRETLKLLEQPMPLVAKTEVPPLSFDREIRIEQLGFQYSTDTPYILERLNLVIPKGARIGFVGQTGSGKSTLLDIIMGLLHPTHGCMRVDGVAITPQNVDGWRAHIAHVPQDIYLTDGTVRENIAFGLSSTEIDDDAIREAARLAQIGKDIESWSQGYETKVGERGVQLSGGQRQRIGIARALYKKADLIIFDEATSALDADTEQAVMDAMQTLNGQITILMIAHRTSTLKNCDQIVELGRHASPPLSA